MSADAITRTRESVQWTTEHRPKLECISLPIADVRVLLDNLGPDIPIGASYTDTQNRLVVITSVANARVRYQRDDNSRFASSSLAAFQQRFRRVKP